MSRTAKFVDLNRVSHINAYLADPNDEHAGFLEITDPSLEVGIVGDALIEEDMLNIMFWVLNGSLVYHEGTINSIHADSYVYCISLKPYFLIKRNHT